MRRLLAPLGLAGLAAVLGLTLFGQQDAPSAASSAAVARSVLAAAASPSSAAQLAQGKTLFDENCASCHGTSAQGGALAPNLRGVGAATVDLWVSSGWMPLATPTVQPIKKPALFNRRETVAIANYVASLTPGLGLPIPNVSTTGASVSNGFSVFALNCAPCHTVTGAGDALSNGISAPSLHGVTKTEIWEAVRTGPGNMPRFAATQLTSAQINDVIAYVKTGIQHPASPGGLSLGGVGPVAEGFIGLFVGVGACLLFALWIGERAEGDDAANGHDGHSDPEVAHV